MSSFLDSTLSFREAQVGVRHVVGELRKIDHCLGHIADAIEPHPLPTLPAELRGVLEVVRTDLIQYAITTLSAIGVETTEGLMLEEVGFAQTTKPIVCPE